MKMDKPVAYHTISKQPTLRDVNKVCDGVPIADFLNHTEIMMIVNTPTSTERYLTRFDGKKAFFEPFIEDVLEDEVIGQEEGSDN
jgi:hypothetical protein